MGSTALERAGRRVGSPSEPESHSRPAAPQSRTCSPAGTKLAPCRPRERSELALVETPPLHLSTGPRQVDATMQDEVAGRRDTERLPSSSFGGQKVTTKKTLYLVRNVFRRYRKGGLSAAISSEFPEWLRAAMARPIARDDPCAG
jgi:hypothetical protein